MATDFVEQARLCNQCSSRPNPEVSDSPGKHLRGLLCKGDGPVWAATSFNPAARSVSINPADPVIKERREYRSEGRPGFRSDTGVARSGLDGSWHCAGTTTTLLLYNCCKGRCCSGTTRLLYFAVLVTHGH